MITDRFSPNNTDIRVCVCARLRTVPQIAVSVPYICVSHMIYLMRSQCVRYSTVHNVQHRMFNVQMLAGCNNAK